MILTLYKLEEGERKESIYKLPFASGRHHRKLMEYEMTIDYTDMELEDTDELVGFVCEVFGKQFTPDEFYDGIPSHKLISTIGDVLYFVRTGKEPAEIETETKNEAGKS